MPKKPIADGLSGSTINNISDALETGWQIFRSLQGHHICTIVRHLGFTGGNPIYGIVPKNMFNSSYEIEVEIDIFTVDEMTAGGGLIKMSDKKFEFREVILIGEVIAIFGKLPEDTINDGGIERAPDFNNLDDCNTIGKPELHGVGIEDDSVNKSYVQYYRIYKIDADERLSEWVAFARLVSTPLQDGSSKSGDEQY